MLNDAFEMTDNSGRRNMYRVTPLAIIFLLKRSETLTLISPDGNLVPVDGEQCENQLEDCYIINGQAEQKKKAIRDLSTDFENETLNEWSDESKTAVRWKAEDYNSPWEVNNLPVKPSIGNRYLRVDRKSYFKSNVFHL
ncbi:hypothetical protein GHT06_014582 [Daphnia sinensis]|uniref:Uncharacterized protein n=1 Tax=Daphnia sinensis TaxID=1820382 RepID=A0AAD5PU23_9CRUS|nr:hypothetical protein GHT06_014582 [Daphnia sinensis]